MHSDTTPSSASADDEFFRSLRALKRAFGHEPNQNVVAITLIEACILHGIDRGPRIREALGVIGCDRDHIGIMLAKNRGPNPARHRWQRGDDHKYRLLDSVIEEPVRVSAAHIKVPPLRRITKPTA